MEIEREEWIYRFRDKREMGWWREGKDKIEFMVILSIKSIQRSAYVACDFHLFTEIHPLVDFIVVS